MRAGLTSGLFAASLLFHATASIAADLKVAYDAEITSLDPHYHYNQVNTALSESLYDALTAIDSSGKLVPALAESWTIVSPTEWMFKLKPGLKFSNGDPVTAEDVVFSLKRPGTIEKSPSSLKVFVSAIKEIKINDPLTISITTNQPAPLLAIDLRNIAIVDKSVVEKATTETINSSSVEIGTGPYVPVHWSRGDRLELKANPNYRGGKPKWDHVTIRFIKAPAARLAALLSGEVNVIQGLLPSDRPRLEANKNFKVVSSPTPFLYFFQPYVGPKVQPYTKAKDGSPLASNPLGNPDVRRAMAMALNKQAIVNALLDGNAEPAGQILLKGLPAFSPNLPVTSYNPTGAKALLAKAGYPDGFQLTMTCGNDRVLYGDKMCLAYAQMLTAIGIKTDVETMPHLAWVPKVNARDFSLALRFWDFPSGEPSEMFKVNYHTRAPDKDLGMQNRGEYSNPALDAEIEEALTIFDDEERSKSFQTMTETIVNDGGMIPLLHAKQIWAMSRNVDLKPNSNGFTVPEDINPSE